MTVCVAVTVVELSLHFVLKVGHYIIKWNVIYKCVCVCFCVFVFVVIEILLCFVLKIGTFTSPVLVLDIGLLGNSAKLVC